MTDEKGTNTATKKTARIARWAVPSILAAILALASLLAIIRVPRTDISLEATASEISFVLSSNLAITAATSVAAVGVSGAGSVQFPLGVQPATRPEARHAHAVILSLPETTPGGKITLAPIVLPAGTQVSIRAGVNEQYRLSLCPPPGTQAAINVSVVGPVEIGFADAQRVLLGATTPKAVTIRAGAESLVLDVHAREMPATLAENISVASVVLARLEESGDAATTNVRRVPTLRTGTLYMDSLNGSAIQLRPGEALQFAKSEGELRGASIRDGDIRLFFSGTVTGMNGGSTRHAIALMPSLLRWLAANQTIGLLWSTVVFLFGASLAVGKWWRGDAAGI